LIQEFNAESARLSEQVHASLVRVESGRWGAGAGTIWHPEGLILTNSHIARSRRLWVTLPDGRRAAARLLARSRDLDLAALSIELSDLPVIELVDSSGRLVGINTVMAGPHVGLAVPVHEVKGFLKRSLQRAAA
jgi:S1-C subfamily serine protease